MSHHDEHPERFEKEKVRKLPNNLTNSEWNKLKELTSEEELKSGVVSQETWIAFLKMKAPRVIRNFGLEE